ncbi:hypothetical protein J010_00047 [Cryptococcus neoformans]|nr:hypothetical protein C355_00065 [Cryptococcus neoformans var. grubii Th84]OXH20166.1 hypothetical protein J010_00047 [Cryptococcus neoformans var. grubii]OXH39818.1 hypothetical protein J009_00066 [Cryptococcus neoformans var. grubii]OXH60279.1 hypothetical protein J003_00074 [Cryptococcus neoformans var. grubii]OXH61004.1 hypothetical protein J004_00070 [Cryptococcus neoformans var. grubii]
MAKHINHIIPRLLQHISVSITLLLAHHLTSFPENQPLTMSSSSSSDSSASYPSFESRSFKRSSIDISNLDAFLSLSITSPYIRETYPPTDSSVVSAVSSVLRGGSFDISVPSEVSAALSERSSAVGKELREIRSGRGRENGEEVGHWMRGRAKSVGEIVESWVSSGATFTPFPSSDCRSGRFSGGHHDRLSTASTPSSGTASTSTSNHVSSAPLETTTTSSKELSSAPRRRLATTTVANLKPCPPTVDPSTVCDIISYIQSADSNGNGNSNPSPTLNEEHWWTAYHALRSPSAFGTHGVPSNLSEKLAAMRALRWKDVESDVGYEEERARMFWGDESLAGSHLEGWGELKKLSQG